MGDTWNESPSVAESEFIRDYASFFLLPSLILIGQWAVEDFEVLGRGPVTCMIFLTSVHLLCDKMKPLINSFIKSSILVMVKMPIPALLNVLDLFNSNKIFISSLSIKYFWKDEETILALFSED